MSAPPHSFSVTIVGVSLTTFCTKAMKLGTLLELSMIVTPAFAISKQQLRLSAVLSPEALAMQMEDSS